MSDYFSLKQFLHLSTNFSAFFCGFWIYLLCTFMEVDWVLFFSRNVSGNAISGSLSFSNFNVYYASTHGLTECKQCCLR